MLDVSMLLREGTSNIDAGVILSQRNAFAYLPSTILAFA